jgi:hypothetical protein
LAIGHYHKDLKGPHPLHILKKAGFFQWLKTKYVAELCPWDSATVSNGKAGKLLAMVDLDVNELPLNVLCSRQSMYMDNPHFV